MRRGLMIVSLCVLLAACGAAEPAPQAARSVAYPAPTNGGYPAPATATPTLRAQTPTPRPMFEANSGRGERALVEQ
jgi:ABC-type glycerol-3-phosphate transport system substrate-binding protein